MSRALGNSPFKNKSVLAVAIVLAIGVIALGGLLLITQWLAPESGAIPPRSTIPGPPKSPASWPTVFAVVKEAAARRLEKGSAISVVELSHADCNPANRSPMQMKFLFIQPSDKGGEITVQDSDPPRVTEVDPY